MIFYIDNYPIFWKKDKEIKKNFKNCFTFKFYLKYIVPSIEYISVEFILLCLNLDVDFYYFL